MFQMQKYQKQMKNAQSLHNWQFQSPNFQKLSNLVPGHSKNLKKSPKVLINQKVTWLVLWWKVSQNVKFSPWTLKIVKNGPWDMENFEKNKFCPSTNLLWQDWSLVESLVIFTQMVPEVWKIDGFSPWWKINWKITKGPYTIHHMALHTLGNKFRKCQFHTLNFR